MDNQHALIVLSTITYLRNVFKESAFTTRLVGSVALKLLINNNETAVIHRWIEMINENEQSIYKITIGMYMNKELRERQDIRLQEIDDYTELCITLQEIESTKEINKIKIKIYANKEIESKIKERGTYTKREEIWKIQNKEKKEGNGIRIELKANETNTNTNTSINTSINTNTNTSINTSINKMRCICNKKKTHGNVLECVSCRMVCHPECAGYLTSKDKRIPKLYQCWVCSNRIEQYDGFIFNNQKWKAIYRMMIARRYGGKTNEALEIMQGVVGRAEMRNEFIRQMEKDGLIKVASGKTKRIKQNKINEKIKRKIKGYFGADEVDCWIGNEVIELK